MCAIRNKVKINKKKVGNKVSTYHLDVAMKILQQDRIIGVVLAVPIREACD